MNRPDPFEERLQRQPLRPMPAAWREEILSAARAAAVTSPAPRGARPSWLSTLNSQLSTLLWPHPAAWAGLAAAWLLVLGFSLIGPEPGGQAVAGQQTAPPRQLRQLLHEQELLYTELLRPVDEPPAERPKPTRPQPRSQVYERLLRA